MKLSKAGLQNKKDWEEAGIRLPGFDLSKVHRDTVAHPVWLHFGAGNIFRGFIAVLQQRLIQSGLESRGIIAADTFDYDMIDQIYRPFDNLALNVGLQADGNTVMEVVASVAEALKADWGDTDSRKRLSQIICDPALQLVSFTITEKGYAIHDIRGELTEAVRTDIEAGPLSPCGHTMSIVCALLLERFSNGAYPIALCSMDNCSRNGERLRESVIAIAKGWRQRGYVTDSFIEYLTNPGNVSFPWSMIDKITPRPSKEMEELLYRKGVEGMTPVVTGKNTYIAPFVNAEIPQYLVIEDCFPNGRPPLEQAGVYLTDRDTVNKVETMKVTTCLNPLHTAMAVFGCLLGYQHIAEEMRDEDIRKLVEGIGYQEGLPVVVDPGIIDPREFIDEVIQMRLPNPYIPDTPQRIATDTSMKIPIRFGETIKSYVNSPAHQVEELTFIPLAIAGWLRYLLGYSDDGEEMDLSGDPMLGELRERLEGIRYDDRSTYHGQLKEILQNRQIFAQDLCEAGIAAKIETMFCRMLGGKGSVRETLHSYVNQQEQGGS